MKTLTRAPKFGIWTSKIMPDLWFDALFCPIKKKFQTPPYCTMYNQWMCTVCTLSSQVFHDKHQVRMGSSLCNSMHQKNLPVLGIYVELNPDPGFRPNLDPDVINSQKLYNSLAGKNSYKKHFLTKYNKIMTKPTFIKLGPWIGNFFQHLPLIYSIFTCINLDPKTYPQSYWIQIHFDPDPRHWFIQ